MAKKSTKIKRLPAGAQKLRRFLVALAVDPAVRARFEKNPKSVMAAAKLPPIVQDAIAAGSANRLASLLDNQQVAGVVTGRRR